MEKRRCYYCGKEVTRGRSINGKMAHNSCYAADVAEGKRRKPILAQIASYQEKLKLLERKLNKYK